MAVVFIQGAGGKPEEEKTVALAMASGDQTVTPNEGTTLSKVTVEKPNTLIPDNIKKDVVIAGVRGTLEGTSSKPEEEKTVTLALAGGNQIVTPAEGKVFSKVTIEKPVTLIPDNIKKGVVIAGVTGTHSGGGVAQPTLNKVTISRNLTNLSISNPSSNGGFANGYKIYSNGNLVTTITSTSYTLTNLPVGNHTLMVKAKGNNFEDAPESNTVDVRICSIAKTLTGLTISNSTTKLADGNTFTATLTPATGKFLPDAVTVTQDGAAVDFTYDSYRGTLTIPAITGDIQITATAWDEKAVHVPDLHLDPATAELSFDAEPYVESYNVYDSETLLKSIKGISYRTKCAETTGGTTLTTVLKNCVAGDLIIAAIVTRSALTVSDGWELISESTPISGDTNNQRVAWAKKIATGTEETLTVTQASSARIYINMLAFPSTCSATDNGYTYAQSAVANITVAKPAGLALFACSATNWSTNNVHISWACNADTAQLVELKTTTQPCLAVFVTDGAGGDMVFTPATADRLTVGCLTITNTEAYEFVMGDQDAI